MKNNNISVDALLTLLVGVGMPEMPLPRFLSPLSLSPSARRRQAKIVEQNEKFYNQRKTASAERDAWNKKIEAEKKAKADTKFKLEGYINLSIKTERDAEGWYTHLDLPVFNTDAQFEKWVAKNNLEYKYSFLEHENNAIADAYYNAEDSNISIWKPKTPEGTGWVIVAIYESDNNGPITLWVRHTFTKG